MESNEKLKETDIKNRTCYYFNDIIKIEDLDLDNSLIEGNSYKYISVYNISSKNLIVKPLSIRFDKIIGFNRVYDGTRYLHLFGSEKYDSIYNTIRYSISAKSGISYIVSHNYVKIKVDPNNSLPLEKQ